MLVTGHDPQVPSRAMGLCSSVTGVRDSTVGGTEASPLPWQVPGPQFLSVCRPVRCTPSPSCMCWSVRLSTGAFSWGPWLHSAFCKTSFGPRDGSPPSPSVFRAGPTTTQHKHSPEALLMNAEPGICLPHLLSWCNFSLLGWQLIPSTLVYGGNYQKQQGPVL